MATTEKVNKLFSRIEEGLTSTRTELESIFDLGSFVEVGFFNVSAAVVTGYGTVGGRLVYGYSQDGPVNVAHAKKIARIYDMAVKMGAPVIGIMNSQGIELEEGADVIEAYGILLSNQSSASGVIPQISIIKGDCIGMSAFIPALSDFIFMVDKARMFMSSPSTFDGLDGKSISYEMLGGSHACAEKGIADEVFKNIRDCFERVKEIITLLPANNLTYAVSYDVSDDLNREDEFLNSLVPDDNSQMDIYSVINSVADDNYFLEMKKEFAPNIITGFIKLNGCTAGIVANNGVITSESAEKSAKFVNFCDSFNIPIISFTDVYGYEKSAEQEKKCIIKSCAKLIYAFSNANVPKINVILRNAVGSGYLLMNSKFIGADIVYSWPTANISCMDKKSSLEIMKIKEEDFDINSTPYYAAERCQIDDIIIPAATRKRVLAALEMLAGKRVSNIRRKHGSAQF